jgi:hypothetical protein
VHISRAAERIDAIRAEDYSDNAFTVNPKSTTNILTSSVSNGGIPQVTKTSAVINGKSSVNYVSSSNTPEVNISTAGYFTYDSNLGIANRTDIVPLQGF